MRLQTYRQTNGQGETNIPPPLSKNIRLRGYKKEEEQQNADLSVLKLKREAVEMEVKVEAAMMKMNTLSL